MLDFPLFAIAQFYFELFLRFGGIFNQSWPIRDSRLFLRFRLFRRIGRFVDRLAIPIWIGKMFIGIDEVKNREIFLEIDDFFDFF